MVEIVVKIPEEVYGRMNILREGQMSSEAINYILEGEILPEKHGECRMCAEEHAQLAAWLKELKAYRAQEHNRFKEIKKEVKARSYYINYHNGCVETGLSTKDILGIIDKYA